MTETPETTEVTQETQENPLEQIQASLQGILNYIYNQDALVNNQFRAIQRVMEWIENNDEGTITSKELLVLINGQVVLSINPLQENATSDN